MIKGIVIVSKKFASAVFGPEVMGKLRERMTLVCDPISREEVEANPTILSEVEVIFCSWVPPVFDTKFLASAPKLKGVFYAAGSFKSFVSDTLWSRGIRVSSAWVINGEAVAEFTFAAIIMGLKQTWANARLYRKTRGLARSNLPMGISGTTVAIISLGASGRAVRDKLRQLDVRVVAYDPHISSGEARQMDVELVNLAEAFSTAQVVSLHTPIMPETIGLIRGSHISRMMHGATLINTARGTLIREQEMISVLKDRTDLTAYLDVSDPEPPAPDSALFQLENVVLTSHIAGALGRDCRRLAFGMIEEFDRFSRSEPLKWEIRAADLAIRA
jgi:phosphoglycerate dehydrogenase-like enzyme